MTILKLVFLSIIFTLPSCLMRSGSEFKNLPESEINMIETLNVKIGRIDNAGLSAIKYKEGKILVSNFGVVDGWFAPGEWIIGDSHKGGGGILLKYIDVKKRIVIFEESGIVLP